MFISIFVCVFLYNSPTEKICLQSIIVLINNKTRIIIIKNRAREESILDNSSPKI